MDKREIIHKMLNIVININGFEGRNKPGHPAAFFDFSGHTNTTYIYFHENGWASGDNYDKQFIIDFDYDMDVLRKELADLRAYAFSLKFRRRRNDI